jgi:hypothetical protein
MVLLNCFIINMCNLFLPSIFYAGFDQITDKYFFTIKIVSSVQLYKIAFKEILGHQRHIAA